MTDGVITLNAGLTMSFAVEVSVGEWHVHIGSVLSSRRLTGVGG